VVNPPNHNTQARQQRLAANSRLSFKNILNSGSPACQSLAIPAPAPAPDIPANAIYAIDDDALISIGGDDIVSIA
jgi:hypothetical protein